jgi:hypothetical protein
MQSGGPMRDMTMARTRRRRLALALGALTYIPPCVEDIVCCTLVGVRVFTLAMER